jgi:chromosomal replication initiation ATPase DnaA
MMVKNRLFVTDLTISTDKSKFDELKNSGKIENYKIIDDVHFFDNKSLLLLVTMSPLI